MWKSYERIQKRTGINHMHTTFCSAKMFFELINVLGILKSFLLKANKTWVFLQKFS